jgi:hypothetical protein
VAARQLILNTLEGTSSGEVIDGFLQDRYADFDDYFAAVRQVWGDAPADRMYNAGARAASEQPTITAMGDRQRGEERVATAVLLSMPEPDFRLAIFLAILRLLQPGSALTRIASVCTARGIPWKLTLDKGFVWTGDEEIENSAMLPAMSAVEDARFAAVKSEFDSARSELALGTPKALKQCVHESGCAVESAMKVVLSQRGAAYDEKHAAFALFGDLTTAGIVPEFMKFCVLGAASPRNKLGGHGAGEVPHDVPQETAEAVLASAAVSITYLHKLLP